MVAILTKRDVPATAHPSKRGLGFTRRQLLKMCFGDPTSGEDVTQTRNLRVQTTYVGNMEETNETSQTGVRRVYFYLARRTPHTDGRRGAP
jgi:hypothetical protein